MIHRKFFHVIVEKHSHFYYEIFEKKDGLIKNMFIAVPVISEFCKTEEDKTERTFNFKTLFDLKHSNSKNIYLNEMYGENRMWFLSSREAIDIFNHCYSTLKNKKVSNTLKEFDELNYFKISI